MAQKTKQLPARPGVYIFKNAAGDILYVGKANKLKNRVRSYFQPDPARSNRIQQMISQIRDLSYVITDNETESLILENNFIKEFQPKYNMMLKDDKNFQFIKINIQDEIPTIDFERKIADPPSLKLRRAGKSARYLGPYTSSYSIKQTLRLIRKIFPYCSNSKVGTKPCFYYHIGKCPGVCIGKISLAEYRKAIDQIVQLLSGWQLKTLDDLKSQMSQLSRNRQYEKAARIRDQIFTINRVLEKQKLVYPKKVDQDIFSLYLTGSLGSINLFLIREGKLIRKENFILKNTKGATPAEILDEFLPKYYLEASSWPREILLPAQGYNPSQPPLNIRGGVAAKKPPLSIRGNSLPHRLPRAGEGELRPRIFVPSRGQKLKLIQLGTENAKQYLESTGDKNLLEEARLLASLKELQRVLNLSKLPGRIEAYDISNVQGMNPVGSMVVFDYGRPKKQDYRRFKIRSKHTPDDYTMMREMLERRFSRSRIPPEARLAKGGTDHGTRNKAWPLPDLILIDGGRGQLNAAIAAISKSQFSIYNKKTKIPIIGLAKRLEEIFLPRHPKPLTLPPNSIALFLLQRIRDEAHRFAVTFHRKLRSQSLLLSSLDTIPGIGPQKKKQLLSKFGSVAALKAANMTELSNVVGRSLAEKIKAKL
ncbi:MAG: excinuclease ABC subunit C [Candidatus Doudnabacteria bacterium]|nr:excinuclease ABC subunit C [Candidatus Doudnabacteria bacterium]